MLLKEWPNKGTYDFLCPPWKRAAVCVSFQSDCDINPASPSIYHTSISPTVFVYIVMQDFYHQQHCKRCYYVAGASSSDTCEVLQEPAQQQRAMPLNSYSLSAGAQSPAPSVVGSSSELQALGFMEGPGCDCGLLGRGSRLPCRSLLLLLSKARGPKPGTPKLEARSLLGPGGVRFKERLKRGAEDRPKQAAQEEQHGRKADGPRQQVCTKFGAGNKEAIPSFQAPNPKTPQPDLRP